MSLPSPCICGAEGASKQLLLLDIVRLVTLKGGSTYTAPDSTVESEIRLNKTCVHLLNTF